MFGLGASDGGASHNTVRLLQLFIDHGAPLDIVDADNTTALILMAKYGIKKTIRSE